MDSDKRKAEHEKLKLDEDIDEDEEEVIEDDQDMEEELHVAIAELLGVLFKTHKNETVDLANLLYTQILPNVLKPEVSEKMHKFGVFLIDDMVEYLGYAALSDKWPHFAEALVKFSASKVCFVRQATVYGIGIFAMNTPADAF